MANPIDPSSVTVSGPNIIAEDVVKLLKSSQEGEVKIIPGALGAVVPLAVSEAALAEMAAYLQQNPSLEFSCMGVDYTGKTPIKDVLKGSGVVAITTDSGVTIGNTSHTRNLAAAQDRPKSSPRNAEAKNTVAEHPASKGETKSGGASH